MSRLPALFVSHGAPDLVLDNIGAKDFLSGYGRELGRPDAILIVTAHFETDVPTLTSDARPEMIYNFRNFQDELYQIVYPAPGDPAFAGRVAGMLEQNGLAASLKPNRGFDHGTWVPLLLLYPEADIPVVQLSVQTPLGPEHHVRLGRALESLRDDNVLVIGSGSMTHNLHELRGMGRNQDNPTPEWVIEFGEWMREKTEAGDAGALLDYRARAPHAERNHPTDEHLLPFFVAMGAGGEKLNAERVHTSHSYGVLQMDAYRFN